eukprot:scaffold64749_cov28-Tisochrysis_lutea.AAC.8
MRASAPDAVARSREASSWALTCLPPGYQRGNTDPTHSLQCGPGASGWPRGVLVEAADPQHPAHERVLRAHLAPQTLRP